MENNNGMIDPKTGFKRFCLTGIILFICLFILYAMYNNNHSMYDHPKQEIKPTALAKNTPKPAPAKPAPKPLKTWHHDESIDEMYGTTNTWDYIYSNNQVYFDMPYEGGSTLKIDIRHMKRYGTDVIVSIDKGQIYGSEYGGENYISFKFDNGPVKKYYFNTAADGDNDCVFMQRKSELIRKFKKAKKIMVEVPFYRYGRQVFKFTVDKPYKSK